jgi:hypothetical protein
MEVLEHAYHYFVADSGERIEALPRASLGALIASAVDGRGKNAKISDLVNKSGERTMLRIHRRDSNVNVGNILFVAHL